MRRGAYGKPSSASFSPDPKPTRKRTKKRAFKTPRCVVRGCKRRAETTGAIVESYCRSHGNMERSRVLSLDVRSIGQCEFAGRDSVRCGGVLQAAHIFPKGAYPRIKYDRENLLCLCAGHHRYYTERWPGWRKMVLELIGQERFDALYARSGA